MPKRTDIERAQTIMHENDIDIISAYDRDPLFVDKNNNNFPDSFEKEIKGEEIVIRKYAAALNHSKSFWTRLRAFFGASTAAGRHVKAIKDFVLLFVPYGKQVGSVTEFITERFIKPDTNQKVNTMEKPKLMSKTIWSAIIILIVAGLQLAGVDFTANPEVVQNIYQAIYLAAGSFGLYGLRDALGKMIKKQEKNT